MLLKDFEIFKQKYKDRCYTKSTNYLVLKLYSFILEHEKWDSDYWKGGGGIEEMDRMLFEFDEDDWNSLNDDLPNWSINQLDLFCNGLLCVDYYKKDFSEDEISNLENRFGILPVVLIIGNSNSAISDNIEDFLKFYFPVINTKDIKVINSIIELKKWNDSVFYTNRETGKLVSSPFTKTIENAYQSIVNLEN